MFLKTLALNEFGIFRDAAFDLRTNVDQPIILFSGNNGAGKTSILEALRLALHGRRAFDIPMGEAEYLRAIGTRFHRGTSPRECSVELEFDYVDMYKTRNVKVRRSWSVRRQRIGEDLTVLLDGKQMKIEDADDLLSSIVPPEIARYFFFDGERIREMAEWEAEDEAALFTAVGDLLGMGLLDQLRADLLRLSSVEGRNPGSPVNALIDEDEAAAAAERTLSALRQARANSRKVRGALDRAIAEVRRVGAMQHTEILAIEVELGELAAERRAVHEEAERAASYTLPLLCARTLRKRFAKEMEVRRLVEDQEIVTTFFRSHAPEIARVLQSEGMKSSACMRAIESISEIGRGSLMAVHAPMPSVSRSEAAWMQRIIEQELPEVANRTRVLIERLRALDERISFLQEQRKGAAIDDPAGDAALNALEARQRDWLEHEATIKTCDEEYARAQEILGAARAAAKAQRLEKFAEGRIRSRQELTNRVLDSLPTLSERLQTSKQQRFGSYLFEALKELWHKTDRLIGVEVSFAARRIALLDAFGEINKRDLSSGEKQLFAVAFIYALAKLSGRLMPFVIDTPLGRLDQQHRRRFVAEFLPNASHQVVLLSTDTEIIGDLYEHIRPLVAHHHELSEYNGGATSRVDLVSA